ncbi:hypothetical protein, partial [Pseudomonas chlororaphis]
IFNSITSLMKAQAYELNILNTSNKNRKKPVVYQFNLISVIDSELIRLKFNNDEILASPIESEDYLSKYILNKKESTSRIKFITAKNFKEKIKEYSTLHTENAQLIEDLNKEFFKDIIQSHEKTRILLQDFREAIDKYLWSPYYSTTKKALNLESIDITWNQKNNEAAIELDEPREIVSALNDDDTCIRAAKKALLEVYKYTGDVCFEEALIF